MYISPVVRGHVSRVAFDAPPPMMGIKSIPWIRIAAESVAIVFSILLAFSIDTWWASRNDRAEEAEILQSIHQDIIATREVLAATRARILRILGGLKTLSDAGVDGRDTDFAEDELASHVLALWDTPSIGVQMSAYDEIRNSGRLRLIDDPQLRIAFAEYDRRLSQAEQIHMDTFENQQLKLDPYLIANADLTQISKFTIAAVESQLEARQPMFDYRLLLEDRVFRNHVAAKYYLFTYYEGATGELDGSLVALQAQVETRLRALGFYVGHA